MQPLTVDFIQSLDGFGAAEGWPGFWGMEGPEYLGWMADSPENEHPILMGANTYRLMHGMAQGGEPGTDVLGPIPKYVFSRSMTQVDWGRAAAAGVRADRARRTAARGGGLRGGRHGCDRPVHVGLGRRVRRGTERGPEHVELEPVSAAQGAEALHVRYRVRHAA
ncbi:dihydrofolate reductase family protein [Actinotalea caeni]|uniref:dihydrofolate reductase family protein n=1 Tax=Actinotalea caeni TaxID=1348467 RepID=UPI0012E162D8|nr:hypothetical protein [Actinotalea caeni]